MLKKSIYDEVINEYPRRVLEFIVAFVLQVNECTERDMMFWPISHIVERYERPNLVICALFLNFFLFDFVFSMKVFSICGFKTIILIPQKHYRGDQRTIAVTHMTALSNTWYILYTLGVQLKNSNLFRFVRETFFPDQVPGSNISGDIQYFGCRVFYYVTSE